jgi:hypothetical protein
MLEIIKEPWPWYVAGPLIGLTVPALLILEINLSGSVHRSDISVQPVFLRISAFLNTTGKKNSGIYSSFSNFFRRNDCRSIFNESQEITVNQNLKTELATYGITDYSNLVPTQLMNFTSLFTVRGFIMMVVGGFLVGFGTRYAGGCTSGHAIMGLSNLQGASLIATICFMAGGFLMANVILPIILSL